MLINKYDQVHLRNSNLDGTITQQRKTYLCLCVVLLSVVVTWGQF